MKDSKGVSRMWQLYKMGGVTPAIASMLGAQNAQQMAFMRAVNRDLRKQSLLDTPFAELETVVFDLETTGFYPYNGDEIISFGAVLLRGGAIVEGKTFYSLVNPKRKVPLHITELTGITSSMAEDAPELMDVLHQFMEFCGKRLLIAHGSGHDKQFLNAALWKTFKCNLTHRVLDTMMVAKWLNPGREAYGLDELLEEEGIPITQRHHALEDCFMQTKLWQTYLERIRSRNIHTLSDLYAYLSQH
ncbi:DNA polymerase-3 subunit epsilon [Paenibacillaceae bacterium GAS479]|nr:DNA polymerase-3 subunit epsilon [Paenibacillaceae bacterium GAS479]